MVWQGIIVLCIVSLAGIVNARTSIINGKDANIFEFRYLVSFRYHNIHYCGGSIVSDYHVVTAGHCFTNKKYYPNDNVTAVTGTSYLNTVHGFHRKIAHVTVHPEQFSDNHRSLNDIAVVKLKNPIVFGMYHQKINLPEHNFKAGEKAVVAGWGLVREQPRTKPDRLQKLETTLMSKEECMTKITDPEKAKIHEHEICTVRENNAGGCYGDSGSPLVAHGELIGVISWFDGDHCASKHPDVYANVYKYKNFILDAMNQH